MVDTVMAVSIQSNVRMVDSTASRAAIKKVIRENLNRACELVDWAARNRYPGLVDVPKIIVLPESFLHAFPRSEGAQVKNMLKVGISIPGEETEVLAKSARDNNAYLCATSYEVDEEWPGRYFNCSFIFDPQGQIILKYRKIMCGMIETGCSPHDILDAYVERYGYDSLFPVVDTPIGKLGTFICADGLFGPEVARCLAMNGAEILCYPISTTSSDHHLYHLVARMRALDNSCYLVSSNLGSTFAKERAEQTGGESVIVDYEGRILSQASALGETTITANLHLDALRRSRRAIACLRAEAYAPMYQRTYFRANRFLETPEQELDDEVRATKETMEDLYDRGILVRPGS